MNLDATDPNPCRCWTNTHAFGHRGQFGGQYRSADNLAAYERMLANASLRIDRHGARFVGVALPDGWTLPPNRMPAVVVGDLARGPE